MLANMSTYFLHVASTSITTWLLVLTENENPFLKVSLDLQ